MTSTEYSHDFPTAWGAPAGTALFKQHEEDFQVHELLGFEADGAGEHLLLQIEKRGLTTPQAVQRLARHFRVAPRDIGYAGLKDRQALTRQWLSLRVGLGADPAPFPEEGGLKVLSMARHGRKLRRGSHRGNAFRIRLRDFQGDIELLNARIAEIAREGLPNYFGEQRFGREQDNVAQALRMFAGEYRPRDRVLRGLLISSARSWLFNTLLARRVAGRSWNRALEGEVFTLDGSVRGQFQAPLDEEIQGRLARLDIHPSGPLWGRGEPAAGAAAGELERRLAEDFPVLCRGLEAQGLNQERRALRLAVRGLQLEVNRDNQAADLMIEFILSRGAYATSVLRELLATRR